MAINSTKQSGPFRYVLFIRRRGRWRREKNYGSKIHQVVLNAWTHSQSTQAPEQAESLLMRIEQLCDTGEIDFWPNTISYSSAIQCWAKSGRKDVSLCTKVLLKCMKWMYKAGERILRPNVLSNGSVILYAFPKSEEAPDGRSFRPWKLWYQARHCELQPFDQLLG